MQKPISGRITLSGYEGSELLVGRLLIECGADLRYVGSACPATEWNAHDIEWLKAKGVQVQMRASLEQDCAAMHEFKPDLAIGTTPVVQKAKELGINPILGYEAYVAPGSRFERDASSSKEGVSPSLIPPKTP